MILLTDVEWTCIMCWASSVAAALLCWASFLATTDMLHRVCVCVWGENRWGAALQAQYNAVTYCCSLYVLHLCCFITSLSPAGLLLISFSAGDWSGCVSCDTWLSYSSHPVFTLYLYRLQLWCRSFPSWLQIQNYSYGVCYLWLCRLSPPVPHYVFLGCMIYLAVVFSLSFINVVYFALRELSVLAQTAPRGSDAALLTCGLSRLAVHYMVSALLFY